MFSFFSQWIDSFGVALLQKTTICLRYWPFWFFFFILEPNRAFRASFFHDPFFRLAPESPCLAIASNGQQSNPKQVVEGLSSIPWIVSPDRGTASQRSVRSSPNILDWWPCFTLLMAWSGVCCHRFLPSRRTCSPLVPITDHSFLMGRPYRPTLVVVGLLKSLPSKAAGPDGHAHGPPRYTSLQSSLFRS